MYDGLEKNLATIEAEYNLKPKYPHYPPEWISLTKERRKRVKSYIKDKKEGKLVVIQRLKENPQFWNPQF